MRGIKLANLYDDIHLQPNAYYRVFNNVTPDKLVWHRDNKTRIVKLISEQEVYLQLENELPLKMMINVPYAILKEQYHRIIIKGYVEKLVIFIHEPKQ